ncbi:PAS domain S-box protein [Hymenobacter gummosus]|uniref:histidine kinase n=1 Tax=Hymenobacter gummosus TaxID=1776032 RepID=A0A431TWY2_9BACT|nr:PAS domain S-box protein [Hymenobacter gummosus]RTQ45912.1 PAS domain S-box protein [Hymenobacter gummosus]
MPASTSPADADSPLEPSEPTPAAVAAALHALPWAVLQLTAAGAVSLLNPAAEALWGVPAAAVLGRAPAAVQPAVLPPAVLQALSSLAADDAPTAPLWLPRTGQWVRLRAAAAPEGGRWIYWETVAAPPSAEKRSADEHLLQHTIDSSLDLVQVFRAVRDEQGEVVDFVWVLNNAAAERVYGDVIGCSLLALNPGVVAEGIFDTFQRVLETGVPDQSERHYVHEQFDGWFLQSTVKLDDGVTTTTHDITQRKRMEQELRESKALLQDIIDAPHIGLAVYRAVRNAAGDIVDFVHEYINRASRAMLGEDFTGKLFTDHGDNGRQQLPQLIEVIESGQGNSYVREASFRGRQVWFAITNAPLDADRLVHTWEDVTERRQAEAEILRLKEELAQQAQDRYYSLFAAMDEGVSILEMIYDDDGRPVDMRWVEVNPAFEKITGLRDVAGKLTSSFVPTEQYWLEAYDSVVKTGKPLRYENYHAGIQQWYRTHTSRIGGPESRVVANVFEDITERKRHEAQLRHAAEAETLRRQLADALGPLTDPVAIQEAVTRLARQHFGADRCYYCEIEHDQAIIRRDAATAGLPSVAGTYPLASFALLQAVIEAGRPLVVRDVRQDAAVDENLRQLCVQLQVISYLDVPVIKHGQPAGVLCLVQSQPRDWTAAEAALAAEVAERTWAAVERARTELALQLSEARLRTLVASLPGAAVFVVDADLRYQLAEGEALAAAGLRPADLLGRTVAEAMPPEQVVLHEAHYRQALAGESFALEHEAHGHAYLSRGVPLPGPAGQPPAALVVSYDITARKQAEAALAASEEKYRALFTSMDEGFCIIEVLFDEQQQAVDYRFLEMNPAFGRQTGLANAAGRTMRELAPELEAFWFEVYGRIALTGEPARFEHAAAALGRYYDVYALRVGAPADRRVAVLFNDIAERKQREQRQQFLLKLSDKLRTEPSADAVANCALRLLGEELGLDRCYIAEYRLEADRADFTHQVGNDRVPPLPAGGIRLSDFPEAFRVVLDRTLVIEDFAQTEGLSDTDRHNIGALGLRALVAATLRQGPHQPHWVVVAVSAAPRRWTPGEIALLEEVTERTWAAMERARAEEALRESEANYRTLFNSMDEGVSTLQLLFDEAGKVVDFIYLAHNPALTRQTGLGPDMVGQRVSTLFPELETYWLEVYERVSKTGKPERHEYYFATLASWFDIYVSCIGEKGSDQVACVYNNITERKRREADAALRVAISGDLNRLSGESEMLAAVGAHLTRHLQLACWHYVDVDEARGEVTLRHFWHEQNVPSILGTYPIADFLPPHVVADMRAGAPAVVADVQVDIPSDSAAGLALQAGAAAQKIGAYIAVPYSVGGNWKAYFAVADSRPRHWTEGELALVQDVAARIFPRIERARAEEALRASEEQFRTVANLVPDLLWRSDAQGGRTWYNQRWHEHTGQPPEDAAGAGWLDVIHPDDRPESERRYRAAVQGGQPLRLEHRVRSAQGEYRWFQVQARPIRDAQGSITEWFGAATDIHARRLSEERLRRSAALDAFRVQLTDALRPLTEPEAIQAAACRVLGEHLGVSRVSYADVEGAELVLRPGYVRSGAPLVGRAALATLGDTVLEAFRRGETLAVDDVRLEARFSPTERARLQDARVLALAGVLLEHDEQWRGVWLLHHEQPRAWTDQELDLLQETAARTWATAERARAGQIMAADLRATQLLRELGARLTSETNPHVLYDELLQAAVQLLRADAGTLQLLDETTWQLRLLATHGISPQLQARFRRVDAGSGSSCGRALASGERALVYFDDPDTPDHDGALKLHLEAGLRAAQSTPLVTRAGRHIGMLSTHWRQPRPLTERQLGFLDLLARQAADLLEQHQAEEVLRRSEEQFRTVANLVPDLLWRCDAQGHSDWHNQRWYEYTGQTPEQTTRHGWQRAIHPADRPRIEQQYAAAAAAGESAWRHECRLCDLRGTYRWFLVQLLPFHNELGEILHWYGAATDIHQRKLAEEAMEADKAWLAREVAERTRALQESTELLQSIYDTSLIGMSVLLAERDETGAVQDFRIAVINRELARETGRTDLVGKLYAQEFPGIVPSGLFALMRRALDTGEPQQVEYYYPFDGFNKWFAATFVKLAERDGLAASNLDITERKRAEEERLKNFTLLQQSEEVARLGSWEYDVGTGRMHWSAGMYGLFGLPAGSAVGPDAYQQAATPDAHAAARRLVQQLRQGQQPLDATLRIRVGEQTRTLRIKSVVVPDEQGRPGKVLGVDVDITDLQRLQAENLRLQLEQQQQLFNAVLDAQETERQRIAEGLHNGVGQLLYATKLQLTQLRPAAPPELWTRTDALLADAIRQTRALSHELVPTVLNEFGLAAALEDICRKLSGPQLHFHCTVEVDEPLPQLLQVAVYRITQELAQNVVKHAGATEATLALETVPGFVLLRAEDNGVGFAPDAPPGLGLRTIRDRVALLGGSVDLGSAERIGTYVRIRLPLPGAPPAPRPE